MRFPRWTQIGRAAWRERGEISVGAGSLKKKKTQKMERSNEPAGPPPAPVGPGGQHGRVSPLPFGSTSVLLATARFVYYLFFFQAEDGIRDYKVTGVQTCALPI